MHEPQRRWTRILLWAVLALAVVALLFTVVFPWVESLRQDPTLGGAGGHRFLVY